MILSDVNAQIGRTRPINLVQFLKEWNTDKPKKKDAYTLLQQALISDHVKLGIIQENSFNVF